MTEQPMSPDMQALAEQMQQIREMLATFRTEQEVINHDIRTHEHAIKELTRQSQDIKNKIFQVNRDLRDAETKINQQAKLEEQQKENERAREEFSRLSDELDDIVRDTALWFDKAYEHQTVGAKRLAIGKRVLLADKMGLGKTLTMFMACDYNRAKRILYITKSDLVPNVVDEARMWVPQRGAFGMAGLPKVQRDIILNALKTLDEYFVVINYEAWRKDKSLLTTLQELQFDTVIADEAHNMKNVKTAAFKGVRSIVFAKNQCPLCGNGVTLNTDGYGYDRVQCISGCDVSAYEEMERREKGTTQYMWCSVKYVYPATGTFILNRPQEIFSSLSLVAPTRFNNLNAFLDRYCTQDYYTGKWKFRPGGVESLMKAIEGNIVARDLKSAGIKLPPQRVIFHNLKLSKHLYPAQWKVIQDLKEFNAIDLKDEKIGIFHLLALITRQRQAITWPAGMRFANADNTAVFQCDASESVKIDAIIRNDVENEEYEGILADATACGERNEHGEWTGDRTVVFSQFKEPLKEIERRCLEAGISVVRMDGDTDSWTKDEIRKDFNRKTFLDNPGYEAKWQVVLANYKSGGVGLNFTDCTQTIILDEEWNPGSRDQAYARTYRIGQTEETTVHVLRVENSIDDWMSSLMEQKEALVSGFESDIELMTALREMLQKDTGEENGDE